MQIFNAEALFMIFRVTSPFQEINALRIKIRAVQPWGLPAPGTDSLVLIWDTVGKSFGFEFLNDSFFSFEIRSVFLLYQIIINLSLAGVSLRFCFIFSEYGDRYVTVR